MYVLFSSSESGKSQFLLSAIRHFGLFQLEPISEIVYVGHTMSDEYRQALEKTASDIGVACHIFLGGIQDEEFQKCWKKKVASEKKFNVSTKSSAKKRNNDNGDEGDTDKNDEDDEDNDDDDDGDDDNTLLAKENPPKRWQKLRSSPRMGSMKKMEKFLESSSLISTPSSVISNTKGGVMTRSATLEANQKQQQQQQQQQQTHAEKKRKRPQIRSQSEKHSNFQNSLDSELGNQEQSQQLSKRDCLFPPFCLLLVDDCVMSKFNGNVTPQETQRQYVQTLAFLENHALQFSHHYRCGT